MCLVFSETDEKPTPGIEFARIQVQVLYWEEKHEVMLGVEIDFLNTDTITDFT